MSPPSILIIGAGIAGPPLASFLLLSPLPASQLPSITIVERRAEDDQSKGQNIDIRGTGMQIIRKLGLEAAIRNATTGEEGCQFVDHKGRVWASFAADKTGQVQTGTSDIEILRGRLAAILLGRLKSLSDDVKEKGGKGVEFLFGDYVEELIDDGEKEVDVRFAKSRERRKFDLVIAADGLQSRTRRMVWGESGEQDRLKKLGMYGGFFSMPSAKTDTEWRRWFHTSGRRGIMVRPSDDPKITTVFAYVINEDDRRLEDAACNGRKGSATQRALLKEYYQDAGWECERINREMETADDFYYDMIAQVKMPKWNKGRVVLLGDAGYCASPISGMGTTLALNGAYSLAEALTRNPHDHVAAFEDYENSMRPLVDRAQALPLGGRVHYLINPESVWGVWILHLLCWFFCWSGIAMLLARFQGPPANAVPIKEHGFTQAAEWRE
ncbi:hypothetical protein CKM354_000749600 [Cercospora kikuchii]|uniref:FAD-binding domain-containing protein n=1 Tax=Cercospora kikuchii TaxID=84275 RepID=A0A9P3CTY0_9PEZI|nr:uncharacterized protein CKM354_000749600 [Cercospora kikuchii]GIZ44293.1 hypothetical protein CKM354_000749600 [Cercospora kikuchii]